MATLITFDEIYAKANVTERQINALVGYLARSKNDRTVKEETASYLLELPYDL